MPTTAADKSPEQIERQRAYQREWYQRNKERIAIQRKQYTADNKDKIRAYKAQWAREHRLELQARIQARMAADPVAYSATKRAYQARYRDRNRAALTRARRLYKALNKERIRASSRAAYHANVERARARVRMHNHARRARLAGRKSERIDRRLLYVRDNGMCGICRRRVSRKTFTIDHIVPIALGGDHVVSNVQIAHFSCNRRKSARLINAQLFLPIPLST